MTQVIDEQTRQVDGHEVEVVYYRDDGGDRWDRNDTWWEAFADGVPLAPGEFLQREPTEGLLREMIVDTPSLG